LAATAANGSRGTSPRGAYNRRMGAVTAGQRLLQKILPRGVFEAIEAGTRGYLLECPCGNQRDLWEAGGVKYRGNEEKTLGHCPACGKRTWQKKRRKTYSERRRETEAGTGHRVFVSGHAWWATVMVWGSAAVVWMVPLFPAQRELGPTEYWILLLCTFVLGWGAPWFWLTTRYRISDTHLLVHSGCFSKSLELGRIAEVSRTRKGLGMSFAFDTKFLWVGYPMKTGGVLISPEDRSLFVLELAKVCPHLELQGNELVPRTK
jgi:hypothetical protein